MPDIFYCGLLAKKLLEKGAYPQYIVKCFEGEIPSLKAKQSENDNYIYELWMEPKKQLTLKKLNF